MMLGRNVLYPKPLTLRQSRRIAISWITIQASKKKGVPIPRGTTLGSRIGNEIVALIEGTSSLLQKRENLHKQAVQNRSNIVMYDRRR